LRVFNKYHRTPNIRTESSYVKRWQHKMQRSSWWGGKLNDRAKNLNATIFILYCSFFLSRFIKVTINLIFNVFNFFSMWLFKIEDLLQ
jgi:hypothetical protein